jgi:hypothetical protein
MRPILTVITPGNDKRRQCCRFADAADAPCSREIVMTLNDVPPAEIASRHGRCRCLTRGLASLLLGSVGLGVATAAAWAQERSGAPLQLDEIVVDGPAKPGAVPPAFAGGQVAQGGRLGLLGNADTSNHPST